MEEAEEALRGKPVHSKMFENLKDRLAVLLQEQKEAAERRKATAATEEESRSEVEDAFVLQTNGLLDRPLPLPGGSHLGAPPPLPTHPAHSLPPHHALPLGHSPHHALPQHSLSPHQHHQPHPQHTLQHPHSLPHAHHHIPQGVLSGHVSLPPDMGHVDGDGLEGDPGSHGHPSHAQLQQLAPHQHSSYVSQHMGISAGTKRKLDDLGKDSLDGMPPPPPSLGHGPNQQ